LELGVKQTLKDSLLLIIFTLVGVGEQIPEKWVLWEHEKDLQFFRLSYVYILFGN